MITFRNPCWYTPGHDAEFSATFPASRHDNQQNTVPKGHDAKFLAVFPASQHKKGRKHRTPGHDAEFSATFPASQHEKERKHRTPGHDAEFSATFPASQHDKAEKLANRNTEKQGNGHQKKDNPQTFRLLRKVSVYLGDVRHEGTGR